MGVKIPRTTVLIWMWQFTERPLLYDVVVFILMETNIRKSINIMYQAAKGQIGTNWIISIALKDIYNVQFPIADA